MFVRYGTRTVRASRAKVGKVERAEKRHLRRRRIIKQRGKIFCVPPPPPGGPFKAGPTNQPTLFPFHLVKRCSRSSQHGKKCEALDSTETFFEPRISTFPPKSTNIAARQNRGGMGKAGMGGGLKTLSSVVKAAFKKRRRRRDRGEEEGPPNSQVA